MTFTLINRVNMKKNKSLVWLEPGEYKAVRLFPGKRVLVDCTPDNETKRELTILRLSQGVLSNDKETKTS